LPIALTLAQIVGLTATVSDGGSTGSRHMPSEASARANLIAFLARMCADRLVCVHGEEMVCVLRSYVPRPVDRWFCSLVPCDFCAGVIQVDAEADAGHPARIIFNDVFTRIGREHNRLMEEIVRSYVLLSFGPLQWAARPVRWCARCDSHGPASDSFSPRLVTIMCNCHHCLVVRLSGTTAIENGYDADTGRLCLRAIRWAQESRWGVDARDLTPAFLVWLHQSQRDVRHLHDVDEKLKQALALLFDEATVCSRICTVCTCTDLRDGR
jgi:hypothetical protein